MKTRTLLLIVVLGTQTLLTQSAETFKPPELSHPDNFTIIMIPDLQCYVRFERNHGIWDLMAAWISENIKPLNIMTAVQVGDIVEANELSNPDGKEYNQTSQQMWMCASNGFARLDGKLPYIVATGNHDYTQLPTGERYTHFPSYFAANRNPAWQGVLIECCTNRNGQKTLENAAYRFKAPSGSHLLFVTLEFAPSDTVVTWAKDFFARPEYTDDIGVLVTHAYMLSMQDSNQLIPKERFRRTNVKYNGEMLWEHLVQPATNIRMVLCGHIAEADDFKGSVGLKIDKNSAGKSVTQILFNTQALGGGWVGNGGDGWLRLLEFSSDCKKVRVSTFSALYAISPTTQHLAWEREDYNNFTFTID